MRVFKGLAIACATAALAACSSSGGSAVSGAVVGDAVSGAGGDSGNPAPVNTQSLLLLSEGFNFADQGRSGFIPAATKPAGQVEMSGVFGVGDANGNDGLIGNMMATADFDGNMLIGTVSDVRLVTVPDMPDSDRVTLDQFRGTRFGETLDGTIDVRGLIVTEAGRAMTIGTARGDLTGTGDLKRARLNMQNMRGGFYRRDGELTATSVGESRANIVTSAGASRLDVVGGYTVIEK